MKKLQIILKCPRAKILNDHFIEKEEWSYGTNYYKVKCKYKVFSVTYGQICRISDTLCCIEKTPGDQTLMI